jgi:Luciferase-like monooxygenase
VIFGVGTGGVPEESAMMGIPFNKRWQIARERIRAMKQIWTKDVFSFHSEYLNVPEARCYPKPVQKPHPPVHIDFLRHVSLGLNFCQCRLQEDYRKRAARRGGIG